MSDHFQLGLIFFEVIISLSYVSPLSKTDYISQDVINLNYF
jgi:hypothetical protein